MKNEVDSKLVLSVFDTIRKHGDTVEHETFGKAHILDGVKAYSDFDGYTLYLEDALVQLSFGFHNTYHFEYESRKHFELFEKKLQAIYSHY